MSAFAIGSGGVDYLGPARLSTDGEPLQIPDLRASHLEDPSDDVYVVSGWLTTDLLATCPVPQLQESPRPALEYYCNGSWVTPTREMNEGTGYLGFADGIQVQSSSWDEFAPPSGGVSYGSAPVQGVYLVWVAGCLTLATGCPVWRMVGRLDDHPIPLAPSPPPSTSPSETVTSSTGIQIYTAQQLSDMIGDPQWVGKTVLADLPAGAIQHDPCSLPSRDARQRMQPGNIDGYRDRIRQLSWDCATRRPPTARDSTRATATGRVEPLAWPTAAGTYAFSVDANAAEYLRVGQGRKQRHSSNCPRPLDIEVGSV